jgi:hypothetical protein
MKKLIALLSFVVACSFNTLLAQPPAGQQMDPAARLAAQKERYKALGLNDVQVDSVIAIQADMRTKYMANFRDMTPEDRQTAMKTMAEARNKRLEAALPADLAKKVEDAIAQQMQRMGGGGGPRQ